MEVKESQIVRHPQIRMGKMQVARDGDQLFSLLGSCVGIALYSRQHRVGGLAHVVLPQSKGNTDEVGKYVDTAIPALIAAINELISAEAKLVAKIAGGASMFQTQATMDIGNQNIEATEQHLRRLGVPISGRHLGGKKGRKMTLATDTGRVMIEIVGSHQEEI